MSFTGEVKDELSRMDDVDVACARAELSSLMRVSGTLSYRGPGRYSIRLSTETGGVARTTIKLTHQLYGLETRLTPRRSLLHKTRNYLIEIPEQPGLERALYDLAILIPGKGLAAEIVPDMVATPGGRGAYLRGAFLAGGFIADPRQAFHMEITVTSSTLAEQLLELMGSLGIPAGLNHRRGYWALYVKNFDDLILLLREMGAQKAADETEEIRIVKSVKNDINRKVNAELANQARSVSACASQLDLISEADALIGLKNLPPAVQQFCRLRQDFPDMSLRDLGLQADPPLSKSALNHRLRRLEAYVKQARIDGRQD